MNQKILYLGDTSLQTAASYLAGCLTLAGLEFDYLPSEQPITDAHLVDQYQLYILSDYPAGNFSVSAQKKMIEHLERGSNLLMIGGWESFHGLGGDWDRTLLEEKLPVQILQTDDRQNCDSPVFLQAHQPHAITDNLPWKERTPLIGGYNRVHSCSDATVLMTAEKYSSRFEGGQFLLEHESSDPLLVVRETEQTRVTALMTDLAPHWVGPFVDWGDTRVDGQAVAGEAVQVGDLYYQFVKQLVNWAGNFGG